MALNIQQDLGASRSLVIGAVVPLDLTITPTLVSGDAFVETVAGVEDSMVDRVTGASAWNEHVITAPLHEEVTYEMLTPTYGAMDGNRVIKAGSGGSVQVRVTAGHRAKVVSCHTGSAVSTVTGFSTYAAGSDSLALADEILSKIGPGAELPFFTNYSGGQTSLTKNADCWLAGVNVSGMAIDGNLFGTYTSANKGALITPQHLLGADHWQSSFPVPGTAANSFNGLRVGQTFRFRGEDGTIHSRLIVGVGRGYGDCVVATLATPLPASVSPFKLAGDWQHRNVITGSLGLKTLWNGGAVFYLDQGFNARFMLGSTKQRGSYSSYTITLNGSSYPDVVPQAVFQTPAQDSTLLTASLVSGKTDFFREGITGDSGSGIFYLVDNEPILVGTFYYPNWCHAVGLANGDIANELIALADANAGITTGLTVTVAPDPTL